MPGTRSTNPSSSSGRGAGPLLESTRPSHGAAGRLPLVSPGSHHVATFAQPPGPLRGTAWRALRSPWGSGDGTQLGTEQGLQLLVSQLGGCGEGQQEVGGCILFILSRNTGQALGSGFSGGHGAGGSWSRAWGFQEDPGTPDFTGMVLSASTSFQIPPCPHQKM